MRKIIFVLLLFPSLVYSKDWFEGNKLMDCGPFKDIVSILTNKEVSEEVVWIGEADTDSQVALFVNKSTNHWTIIQYNQSFACVVEMGRNFKNYSPKQKSFKQ